MYQSSTKKIRQRSISIEIKISTFSFVVGKQKTKTTKKGWNKGTKKTKHYCCFWDQA